jgi:hypothetical protein
MVVGGGFEPPKASPADLQSAPFGRSGTPPRNWSQRRDSNPRPTDYKSVALPTELRWRIILAGYQQSQLTYVAVPILNSKHRLDDYTHPSALKRQPEHLTTVITNFKQKVALKNN